MPDDISPELRHQYNLLSGNEAPKFTPWADRHPTLARFLLGVPQALMGLGPEAPASSGHVLPPNVSPALRGMVNARSAPNAIDWPSEPMNAWNSNVAKPDPAEMQRTIDKLRMIRSLDVIQGGNTEPQE